MKLNLKIHRSELCHKVGSAAGRTCKTTKSDYAGAGMNAVQSSRSHDLRVITRSHSWRATETGHGVFHTLMRYLASPYSLKKSLISVFEEVFVDPMVVNPFCGLCLAA